jgi:hypothetical protein
MTKGLVKASEANKELIVGKEVQKMFIPLFTDSGGRKMTTGKETSDYADFLGITKAPKGYLETTLTLAVSMRTTSL